MTLDTNQSVLSRALTLYTKSVKGDSIGLFARNSGVLMLQNSYESNRMSKVNPRVRENF